MKKNKEFVLECLKKQDMSASDFVEQHEMAYDTAYGYLKKLKSSGLIHVSCYQFRRKTFAAKFRYGAGDDAKRPTVKDKSSCEIKTPVVAESRQFRFFREMSRIWDAATMQVVRGAAC